MLASGTGNATPEKRKGRAVLSVRDPLVESLLAGLGIEADKLGEIRAFCKVMVSRRNRWDIARRRSGLFGSRLLRREDAPRALKAAMAELEGVE